jgi:hypothetical protein
MSSAEAYVLSGNLSEIRLPVLLMSLYRDRETGVLALTNGLCTKSLYVKEGKVVYATSSDPEDQLGECLFRRGLIGLKAFLESAEEGRAGRRQGEVLVDIGALTPEGLVEGVTQQLYDIIYSVFDFRSGTYTLELAPFSTVEMITLSVEIPAVVFRGLERQTAWGPIFAEVGDPSVRVRAIERLPSFLPGLELNSEQEHVLGLCREGMAVASIVDASYLPPFQTYRLLWLFLILGLIEKESPARRSERPANPEVLLDRYNDLYTYVTHFLGASPSGPEAIREACAVPAATFPDLAPGQEGLLQYGKMDVDAILWALRRIPDAERIPRLQAYLEEILYALVLAAESTLPPKEREAIRSYIHGKAQSPAGGH